MTLRQYIYSSDVLGLAEWPSGTLRLEGIEVTNNPREADVFTVPGSIRMFEVDGRQGILDHTKLNRLPHFKGNESRHAFFDVSDNFTQPVNLPILFIKCDARTWMLPHDTNTIQMGWPVEDYSECIEVPTDGFKYDVSFQGWLSSEARMVSSESCQYSDLLKCDFATYNDFFGYRKPEDPEFDRRRSEFRRSMRESRVSLCPESIAGVLPYRFFEAMSAGRVPVLVSDAYVLPFADEIPYDDFICRISTTVAESTGQLIRHYLDATTDTQLTEKGRQARHYWERYLDCRKWPSLMAEAVRKKLGCPVLSL